MLVAGEADDFSLSRFAFAMHALYRGSLETPQGTFAIVVSRYNESITTKLLEGALRTLEEHGVPHERADVVWVPGAFEIPVIASKMATAGRYAAVLCLGAVIRGETTHDEHINRAVSSSLAEIGVRTGIPVLFGLLTCNNLEQAIQRSGGSVGNKGSECAAAAIEMVNLLASIDSSRRQ